MNECLNGTWAYTHFHTHFWGLPFFFPDLPATPENMEEQYNPHFTAQETEVPQEGHLFAQACKQWYLRLSWLLPGTVLSSPQVENQQQDEASGPGLRTGV